MSPVLVPAMAQGGVGEPPSDKLHPFFAKATRNDASPAPATSRQPSQTRAPATENAAASNSGDELHRTKRRKTEPVPAQEEAEASKPRRRRRRKGVLGGSPMSSGILSHLKRDGRCSETTEPNISESPGSADAKTSTSNATVEQHVESEVPIASVGAVPSQHTPQITKRILKVDTVTGTLGPPPKHKIPSLIVCIRYGRDDQTKEAVGEKVTQILDGKLRIPDDATSSPALSTKQNREPKTTHPFFAGKTKSLPLEQPAAAGSTPRPAAPKRTSVFMSTPVSPRKQRNALGPTSWNSMAKFGIKSAAIKMPGAMHAMWPAAGMSHVRGGDVLSTDMGDGTCREPDRKSKGLVTAITPQESILTHLLDQLDLKSVCRRLPEHDQCFTPPPPELRLPQRRFESGRELQKWIRPRLSTPPLAASTGPDDSSQDELSAAPPTRAHPAICRHFHSLRTNLSAFDRSTCESLAWTQKYAPATAAQVLQTGKETALLKQWLEALKVQSIEAGNDGCGDKGKAKSDAPSRKKRRKNKLEGFVVDSDDDENEMDELSEVEDEANSADMGLIKRSLVRGGDAGARGSREAGKLRNTIVISGPHGCGKTAAVYAVAKEIGFEVFEINPSSRRSGRDILEKVGDMTRNHLVQQHRSQAANAGGEAKEEPKEPKPRAGVMMTSFFKPKPTTGSQRARLKAQEKSQRSAVASAPKRQKQSLILLEEADVLYEEDKQFWTTLMGMMTQSKRPFVVTCSDESLIPLQSLSLHGIFRFSPPPVSLAVDVCLLIAANEGHALARTAVESLYRSRDHDLRAAISELNFWCQMGVGDRRGGFDWFYPRWPKGSDVDAHGDAIRVVSEGTYLHGMGWIGRDPITAAPQPLAAEEEALRQAWDWWRLDMGDWHGSSPDVRGPAAPAKRRAPPSSSSSPSPRHGAATAEAAAGYDAFCSAMSAADVCAGGAFGTLLEEPVDATQPALGGGARDDFTIGRALLEADPTAPPTSTRERIATALKALARSALPLGAPPGGSGDDDASAPRPVDAHGAVSALDASFRTRRPRLSRHDLSLAFDPIAVSASASSASSAATHLDASVFDRPLRVVVLDAAPWVRGIVASEQRLMQARRRLGSLLGSGGQQQPMRTTRAAYSALEGGERRTTRGGRYFGGCLAAAAVMRTAPASFLRAGGGGAEERAAAEW